MGASTKQGKHASHMHQSTHAVKVSTVTQHTHHALHTLSTSFKRQANGRFHTQSNPRYGTRRLTTRFQTSGDKEPLEIAIGDLSPLSTLGIRFPTSASTFSKDGVALPQLLSLSFCLFSSVFSSVSSSAGWSFSRLCTSCLVSCRCGFSVAFLMVLHCMCFLRVCARALCPMRCPCVCRACVSAAGEAPNAAVASEKHTCSGASGKQVC